MKRTEIITRLLCQNPAKISMYGSPSTVIAAVAYYASFADEILKYEKEENGTEEKTPANS